MSQGNNERTPKQRAPKRGNGEGGIRKRPNGRWEMRYTAADGSRKSISGATREEVASKLATAISDRNKGLPVATDEKQTVKQYLEGWLVAIRGTLRPKTWVGYEGYTRLRAVATLGRIRLVKLTPSISRRCTARSWRRASLPPSSPICMPACTGPSTRRCAGG